MTKIRITKQFFCRVVIHDSGDAADKIVCKANRLSDTKTHDSIVVKGYRGIMMVWPFIDINGSTERKVRKFVSSLLSYAGRFKDQVKIETE